jgi:hypothetical protein
VSEVFSHFPLVMFCKHSLQSASHYSVEPGRRNQVIAELALKAGCGLLAPSLKA